MKKLVTKLGNAVICQEKDLVAAQNLIKLLDLFESDQENINNFYNQSTEKFEVELIFKNWGGRTLSQVRNNFKEELLAEKDREELNILAARESELLEKANHYWCYNLDRSEVKSQLKIAQDQIGDFYKKFRRPEKIELDNSMSLLLTNFDTIFDNINAGAVFGQFEVLLHEICHIYTANIYNAHGREFKSNCELLANKVSATYWPVNAIRLGRSTYNTRYYQNITALIGA